MTKGVINKKVVAKKAVTKKITARKVAAKKLTARKVATKKVTARKVATKKVTARKVAAKKVTAKKYNEFGLVLDSKSGIIIPVNMTIPVPVSKLQKGVKKAQEEINSMMKQMLKTLNTEFHLKEIELSASFSAKGEFLGIGVGGSATIKFKFSPSDQD